MKKFQLPFDNVENAPPRKDPSQRSPITFQGRLYSWEEANALAQELTQKLARGLRVRGQAPVLPPDDGIGGAPMAIAA